MLLERIEQQRVLARATARACAGRGCSVLVTGPHGSGMSTVLVEAARQVSDHPSGWLVLQARASPEEAGIEGALLQQLLAVLLEEAGHHLDPVPRQTLERASRLEPATPALVPLPMAVLHALQVVSSRRPVLVLVDDVAWADDTSARVLRFVCRRLARMAVCVVLTAPTQIGEQPHGSYDVDEVLVLAPVSRAVARRWLEQQLPDIDPVQAEVVVRLGAGLPGRLVDLLQVRRASTDVQLDLAKTASPTTSLSTASTPASTPLPSVARARRALAAASPGERAHLVAVGVVDDSAAVGALQEAASWASSRVTGALRVAERGAVVVEGDAPVARPAAGSQQAARAGGRSGSYDPLLAALAVADADPLEVDAAHQMVAEVLERAAAHHGSGELRLRLRVEAARQRAQLCQHPEAARAEALAVLARRMRGVDLRRCGDVLEMAAGLHEDPQVRAALLYEAAAAAWVCGRQKLAETLADRAMLAQTAPASRSGEHHEESDQQGYAPRATATSDYARTPHTPEHHAAMAAGARWRALVAFGAADVAGAIEHLHDAVVQAVAASGPARTPRAGDASPGAAAPVKHPDPLKSADPVDLAAHAAHAAEDVLGSAAALVLLMGRRTSPLATVDAAVLALPAEHRTQLRSIAELTRPWSATTATIQQQAFTDTLAALDHSWIPVLRWAVDAGIALGRTQDVADACSTRQRALPASGPAALDGHLALAVCQLHTEGVTAAREQLHQAELAAQRIPAASAPVAAVGELLDCLSADRSPEAGDERLGSTRSSGEDDLAVVSALGAAGHPERVSASAALLSSTERAGAVWAGAHSHRLRGRLDVAAQALAGLWPAGDYVAPAVFGEPAGAGALLYVVPYVFALHSGARNHDHLSLALAQTSAWASGSAAPLAISSDLLCRAVVTADVQEQHQLLHAAEQAANTPALAAVAQLAAGMALRRQRRGVAARQPLTAAVTAFEAAGKVAFSELARRELDATAPSRPSRPMGSKVLTSQERAVAALAASGLSNADIAASLGISARTVAHHLQHVYAKLGVAGRGALVRALMGR